MEVNNVFTAQPLDVFRLFSPPGQHYYIPPYQRDYSWNEENVSRLFEDIRHGMFMLLDRVDSISFLGTTINIHDIKYSAVEPQFKSSLPSRVLIVIDGQQRLTTIILLAIHLHARITKKLKKFPDSVDSIVEKIRNDALAIQEELEKIFMERMPFGEDAYKCYPKIIRAFDDAWSTKAAEAKYNSPISRFIFQYSQSLVKKGTKQFKYVLPDSASEQDRHKILVNNYRVITQKVDCIDDDDFEQAEKEIMPHLRRIINSNNFQSELFNVEFTDQEKERYNSWIVTEDDQEKEYFKTLNSLIFARYILRRVALTVVTAKNEDYAFDMFESLNTTGQPLTAIETFKPLVIKAETLEKYKSSPSFGMFEKIDTYMKKFKRAEEKQNATNSLLIPFALTENGTKLPKRLSDQRRFLRDCFRDDMGLEEKREFTRDLSFSAEFINTAWPARKSDDPEISILDSSDVDMALLLLDVLRQANHEITLAPLFRFYSKICRSSVDEKEESKTEFMRALKAIVAFFVFWRGSRTGTKNIDDVYRKAMEIGIKDKINGLCRQSTLSHKDLKAQILRNILVHYLVTSDVDVSSKEKWTKAGATIPLYRNNNALTAFMLLVSTYDTAKDSTFPGLIMEAKKGTLNLFNFKGWRLLSGMTIEHIAPVEGEKGWDAKIYENEGLLHGAGNLTLLPEKENSSVGNSSWERKVLYYKILSATTNDQVASLIKAGKDEGIKLNLSTEQILANSNYLPHLMAIAECEKPWDAEIIRLRGERIYELVWERISSWLF